jgi:molecular chaperone GrpE
MTKKNDETNITPETEQEEVVSIPLDDVTDNVEQAKKEVEEYKNHLQRLQAEFDNYRKRTAESNRQSRFEGICDVVCELLPAIDNLERGIAAVSDQSAKNGMELILKQFLEVLAKFDVCEIKAIGEDFNPDYHHAISKDGDGEQPVVTEVYLKGYQRKSKILRPCMVKVTNK